MFLTIFGTSTGFQSRTFGSLPFEQIDQLIDFREELPLSGRDWAIVVARWRLTKGLLTWIGLYRPAHEIHVSRGGHYGVGLWIIDQIAPGAMTLQFLEAAADEVARLALHDGKFTRQLTDITDAIQWPETLGRSLRDALKPWPGGGVGTGDRPTAWMDCSVGWMAQALGFAVDVAQIGSELKQCQRLLIVPSSKVAQQLGRESSKLALTMESWLSRAEEAKVRLRNELLATHHRLEMLQIEYQNQERVQHDEFERRLEAEMASSRQENDALIKQNAYLSADNSTLRKQSSAPFLATQQRLELLQIEYQNQDRAQHGEFERRLQAEMASSQQENGTLIKQNADLSADNSALRSQSSAREHRVAELEALLKSAHEEWQQFMQEGDEQLRRDVRELKHKLSEANAALAAQRSSSLWFRFRTRAATMSPFSGRFASMVLTVLAIVGFVTILVQYSKDPKAEQNLAESKKEVTVAHQVVACERDWAVSGGTQQLPVAVFSSGVAPTVVADALWLHYCAPRRPSVCQVTDVPRIAAAMPHGSSQRSVAMTVELPIICGSSDEQFSFGVSGGGVAALQPVGRADTVPARSNTTHANAPQTKLAAPAKATSSSGQRRPVANSSDDRPNSPGTETAPVDSMIEKEAIGAKPSRNHNADTVD